MGCKWQPMYDTKGPSKELAHKISTCWQLPAWLAELGVFEETFVGVMCVRCGKTICRDDLSKEDAVSDP